MSTADRSAPESSPTPNPVNEDPLRGGAAALTVRGWLANLDSRLRRGSSLHRTAALLPGAAAALLLARWFDFLLLDSVLLSAVALSLLVAGAFFWRYAREPRDEAAAASTVDRRASLDDLVKTAARLERDESDAACSHSSLAVRSGDGDLRSGIRRLVIGRARGELSALHGRDVEPTRIPRGALWGGALLLFAAVVPLPSLPGSSAAASSRLVSSQTPEDGTDEERLGADTTSSRVQQEVESDAFEPRQIQEIAQLDPRLAALLQAKGGELDAEALAQLTSSAQDGELSQDTLARLEELVERFGEELEESEGLSGGDAQSQRAPGEFEELSRKNGAPSPPPRDDSPAGEEGPHAQGESASAGDGAPQPDAQGAAAGEQAGDERVQAIEMPPTGDSKLRQADGQEADLQLQGDGMQVAGEQAGTQAGEQRPGAGGGDSSGPQSGDSQLFGEELPESQIVTLELTLLKAREEAEEREQRPERRWRASKRETSKVGAERLPEGDWSQPDAQADRALLPRHHRENLRQYFTPTPTTPKAPQERDGQQKQNSEGERP